MILTKAVILMNLALAFYTWAVFSGRKHNLHKKHLVIFGIGLLCDYLGTSQMNMLGKAPGWHNDVGVASLAGMAFHFLLALAAALPGTARIVNGIFHRVSLVIYSCWLIAFLTGAIYGTLFAMKA